MKLKVRINNLPTHGNGQLVFKIEDKNFNCRDYHCDTGVRMNRIYGACYEGSCSREVSDFSEVEGFDIDVTPKDKIVVNLIKRFECIVNEKGEIELDFDKNQNIEE